MANAHSTLASLFTDIAKAIRSKTGGTASIVADNFPTAISSIEVKENLTSELSTQDSLIAQINSALANKVGKELPVLSNPAGAGNIEAGYQAIDGSGNLINGTFSPIEVIENVPVTFKYNASVSTGKMVNVAADQVTGFAFQPNDYFIGMRLGVTDQTVYHAFCEASSDGTSYVFIIRGFTGTNNYNLSAITITGNVYRLGG